MSDPVRLALIGFGKWGRNYVKAARDSGDAEVTCGMASSPGPRDGIMMFGPNPTHYEDMAFHAGGVGVDAFVVARHPAWAADTCERLLALGKPILIEKPAGLSLADAERIVVAEAKSKAFVLVGHQHLFAEKYEELRAMEVRDERACTASTGPTIRDYDPLWDYGPHAVSLLLGMDIVPRNGNWIAMTDLKKRVGIITKFGGYDGYAPAEPALTRQVRAFARAVRAGGTDDYRFGAKWAVDVARVLEAASTA